jgi:hypothetical protein
MDSSIDRDLAYHPRNGVGRRMNLHGTKSKRICRLTGWLMALFFFAPHSLAQSLDDQYKFIREMPFGVVYIKIGSEHFVQDAIKMMVLINYNRQIVDNGFAYNSSKFLIEMSCGRKQGRIWADERFEFKYGVGRNLIVPESLTWQQIGRGILYDALYANYCKS